jgi:hypothetical protein
MLPNVRILHRHFRSRKRPGDRMREEQREGVVGSGGPSHFLASGAPTGATLLKRRHLQLLGHALVSVPYWEWDEARGQARGSSI